MDSRKFPVRSLLTFVLATSLLWGGLPGCNYSTSYFRLDADGKKIKAAGPITADELANPAIIEGIEREEEAKDEPGEDIPIAPTEDGSLNEDPNKR